MDGRVFECPREEEASRRQVHADDCGILDVARFEDGRREIGQQGLSIHYKLIVRSHSDSGLRTRVVIRPENGCVTIAAIFQAQPERFYDSSERTAFIRDV